MSDLLAHIIHDGTVLLPHVCPVCSAESYAPAGSLCEICYPEQRPFPQRSITMNPSPHDATKAACGFCQQTVTEAVLRPVETSAGTVQVLTCPHCGAVWSGWPVPQGAQP